jgi:hypothetical protein
MLTMQNMMTRIPRARIDAIAGYGGTMIRGRAIQTADGLAL